MLWCILCTCSTTFPPSLCYAHRSLMHSKPGTQSAQMATKGLGQHFSSPKCPRDKNKTNTLVPVSILNIKCRCLLACLNELESKPSKSLEACEEIPPNRILDNNIDIDDDAQYLDPMDTDYVPTDNEDSGSLPVPLEDDINVLSDGPDNGNASERRVLPDLPAQRLYTSWKRIIPTLVTSYQHYTSRTLAKPLSAPPTTLFLCNQATCSRKTSKLLCLFFDRKFYCLFFRSFD